MLLLTALVCRRVSGAPLCGGSKNDMEVVGRGSSCRPARDGRETRNTCHDLVRCDAIALLIDVTLAGRTMPTIASSAKGSTDYLQIPLPKPHLSSTQRLDGSTLICKAITLHPSPSPLKACVGRERWVAWTSPSRDGTWRYRVYSYGGLLYVEKVHCQDRHGAGNVFIS